MSRLSVSICLCLVLLAMVSAQYSNPVQVGPSTNPAPVTQASINKISELATNMYNRWIALDQACDPRAIFAVAYLFMTANAKRLIVNNYFDDGNKMAGFIQTFATRYLTAYDAYATNNLSAVSKPWKIHFDFEMGNHSDVTEDVTLGMNAHINYDLAIATYESGYTVSTVSLSGGIDYPWAADYYRVNDLMNQIDTNITHALGRYDAQFYNTDFFSQAYFTASVQAVTSWRTYAWTTALGYQTASPTGARTYALLKAASEDAAATAAGTFALPYPYSTRADRLAYCLTQHNQPIGV